MRRARARARSRDRPMSRGRPTARALLLHRRGSRPRRVCAGWRSTAATPALGRRRAAPSARSRNRATARCVVFDRATAMRIRRRCSPCRGDGTGERRIESLNRALLARHALGEVREVTVKGWGGEPVQMLVTYPPNFDPSEEMAAAAFDPRRPARRARRRLALPLEHAGVRRPRLRRRRASTITARPASARNGSRRSPASTARRSTPTSRPATDLHAAAGLHRPHAPGRDRRQLWRLHGRLHERPHRSLPDLRLPRRLLRLGEHDGDRRLPLLRQGARRVPLGQSGAGDEAVAASLRASARRRRRS